MSYQCGSVNDKSLSHLLKKILQHITLKRRKQIGLLFVLMLITSVADVISIGAVIPFLAVLSNPEAVFQNELVGPLLNQVGVAEPSELLFPVTAAFAVSAVIAGGMRIVLVWVQARLSQAIGADFSYQIYQRTLYQPYSVHISRNSSEIIAGIASKANSVVGQAIQPVLVISNSFLMLITVTAALVMIDPIVTIVVILGFGLVYGFLIFITKSRLIDNSSRINLQTNQVFKILQEGLGGIRDVLIDGKQSVYCKAFRTADIALRRANANNQILAQSPRFGIESLGMVLVAAAAYSFGSSSDGLTNVLPLLGALALGAQRMLPMMQQAYASWSSIRGSQTVLRDALQLLEQPLPDYVEGAAGDKVKFFYDITLSQLGFRYRDDAPWVLECVDLKIRKGSRVGFVGKTGNGKSTLLDIVMGLLLPTKGELLIDGVVITEQNFRGWQSHIAHIPQNIFLSDATIAENIAFGIPVDQIDYQRVRLSAQQAHISETVESWELQYQTVIGERGVRLSGGQRQRIGIARALYKDADLLIFDEATSALDNQTESAVMKVIDDIKEDITILIVAHRVTTLRNCDQIVELENGKINRIGSYQEVIVGSA